MAVRKHVVAARGATEQELTKALAAIGVGPSGESDGWAWMRLEAGADERALDAALDTLPGPTLRTSMVDGALWTLRLGRAGTDPFMGAHWFILLGKDRVDLEAAEYDTLGGFWSAHELPMELVDDANAPVEPESYRTLLDRHAAHLVAALGRFDIPHDPEQVVAILTGARITPSELGWDVGNLPRFLEALGLGAAVEGWRDDLDEEEEELARQAAALAALRRDPLATVRERIADDTAPTPMADGPVDLPVAELVLLRDIGAQCANGFAVGISLSADGNDALLEPLGAIDGCHAGRVGDRIDLLLDDWAELSSSLGAVSDILAGAAPATALEVVTAAVTGPPNPTATQVYRGPLEDGAFRIADTLPAMSAHTLTDALALMREYRAEGPVRARDEAEAQTFLTEAPRAIWFPMGEPDVTLDGLTLTVAQWYDQEGVIQWFFAHRFGSTWDVSRRMAWHRDQVAQGG